MPTDFAALEAHLRLVNATADQIAVVLALAHDQENALDALRCPHAHCRVGLHRTAPPPLLLSAFPASWPAYGCPSCGTYWIRPETGAAKP